MITQRRKDFSTGDLPEMTRDELEREWHKARESYDEALVQKTAMDQIYLAAANKLNKLDRLIQKVERNAADAKRAAARTLLLNEKSEGKRTLR